jgi:hypothetical protein
MLSVFLRLWLCPILGEAVARVCFPFFASSGLSVTRIEVQSGSPRFRACLIGEMESGKVGLNNC